MTSLAFILGVLPLVIAQGAGAEMRQSLGIAVFAGMIGVTIFGLLFTPVFYVVTRWLAARVSRKPRQPLNHLRHDKGGGRIRRLFPFFDQAAAFSSTSSGRRWRKGVATSKACAARKSIASAKGFAASWIETGRPLGPKPEGTQMAAGP